MIFDIRSSYIRSYIKLRNISGLKEDSYGANDESFAVMSLFYDYKIFTIFYIYLIKLFVIELFLLKKTFDLCYFL